MTAPTPAPVRLPAHPVTDSARLGATLAAAGVNPDAAALILYRVEQVVAQAVSEAIGLVVGPILQAQAEQYQNLSVLVGNLPGLAPWARGDRDLLAARAAQAADNLARADIRETTTGGYRHD